MDEKITVLYVDDEPINLDIFRLSLRNYCDVLTAESGDAGLHILNNEDGIKHVITDFKMPGMDGLEFIKLAKNEHPDIKFYILSGFNLTPKFSDALHQKIIVDFFEKPIDFNKILRALKVG